MISPFFFAFFHQKSAFFAPGAFKKAERIAISPFRLACPPSLRFRPYFKCSNAIWFVRMTRLSSSRAESRVAPWARIEF